MAQSADEVILTETGRAGLIRLNRPKALNALTHGMLRALEAFYHRCARTPHVYGIVMEGEGRAFSSGGDIRAVYELGREKADEIRRYYQDEYQHNWTLESFKKPHVALIDGVVMGGGVGASIYGTHRVAGEGFRFAMPETGIGFFPDVGGGWFLPRLPGKVGLYLGLTGTAVGPADAYYLGLATHCIPSQKFETIKAAMIEAEPIDPVLDALHETPEPSGIKQLRPAIDRIFSAPSVEDIFRSLEREKGQYEDFARSALETLTKRSPLSLKVAFEQLRRGKDYKNLKEALIVEYRLVCRFLSGTEFYEGIRAAIIDKGQSPVWGARSLGEVGDEYVRSLFEPLPGGDLKLNDYWSARSA